MSVFKNRQFSRHFFSICLFEKNFFPPLEYKLKIGFWKKLKKEKNWEIKKKTTSANNFIPPPPKKKKKKITIFLRRSFSDIL